MEIQERLAAGAEDEDQYRASDSQLEQCCECDREVYVADEDALRTAFAPATIRRWTQDAKYADGTPRYSAGDLAPGAPAPDFTVHLAKQADGSICSGVGELVAQSLLSFRQPERCLVVDFGSFS